MRESNFAFPAQNKACVCISSQLYDRRALDTLTPLPLFNSLTHLTYLTSTSPRIREIMTMDGGLERLVRILHEFCISPPPPEIPSLLYGLIAPSSRPPKLPPALNPSSFDKHAAYRFSLAFQCVVNIGVRGSEPIRSRVVQAGTLDVVGCILEAWLANKGFAVGPSSSATGLPRETREQRQARRTAMMEQRQRDEAAHLQRALQRQLQVEQVQMQRAVRQNVRFGSEYHQNYEDESMDVSISQIVQLNDSAPNSDTDASTDTSIAATPLGSGTPTGSVVVPTRDRSGTIIARPVWDRPPNATNVLTNTATTNTARRSPPSTDISRPDTETEDDGDGDADIDMDRGRIDDSDVASASASPSPERPPRRLPLPLGRRAVGIVTDDQTTGALPPDMGMGGLDTDAHIIINDAGAGEVVGGVGVEVGVEDGIVSLEANDDFAMGAPPGAPGAINAEGGTPRGMNFEGRRRNTNPSTNVGEAPDVTPRAGVVGLPMMVGGNTTIRGPAAAVPSPAGPAQHHQQHQRNATIRAGGGRVVNPDALGPRTDAGAIAAAIARTGGGGGNATTITANNNTNNNGGGHHAHTRDAESSGPYRDEDVLLSLQLLAYLSKYPHVRQAFYKPRVTFHPASLGLAGARYGVQGKKEGGSGKEKEGVKEKEKEKEGGGGKDRGGGKESFFRAFANVAGGSGIGRGKERPSSSSSPSPSSPSTSSLHNNPSTSPPTTTTPLRQTNVFSLVERFTFKPSSTETDLPNPPPRLPPEIQYWAGVIMRNACRKDDSRGGIRQCANMLCGRWETYPREFAKCRRCRKAKYCGKECQSTAWSEGHRFWCSAKDVDEDVTVERERERVEHPPQQQPQQPHGAGGIQVAQFGAGDVVNVPVGREVRRTRERDRVQGLVVAAPPPLPPHTRAEGSMARDRTLQQHQHQLQASPHTRIRSRQGHGQQVQAAPDPTNAAYLTFQVQGQESSGNGRRRAETITGLGGHGHAHRLVDVQIPPTAPAPSHPHPHPHRMIPRHPLHHQPQGPLVPQEWFSPPNFRGRGNEPGPSRRTNPNQNQSQTRRMDVSPTTTTTSLSYRGSSASASGGGDDNDMVLG